MRIKPFINKNVTVALINCRSVLVQETVNLLKQLGAENGQDVLLKEMVFLYQRRGNTTETVVCDRVAYDDRGGGDCYYLVSMDGGKCYSSVQLNIDSMLTIFDAVCKVVRAE